MIDCHNFCSIEATGRHKVDTVQPAVLGRVRLDTTKNTSAYNPDLSD